MGEQHLLQAEAVEHRTFAVGSQQAGLLLLQVSKPTQRQSVKVLKVDQERRLLIEPTVR